MFKVNYKNTRTRCDTCSNLTIKTPVNFEHISHLFFSLSIVNFEQVNVSRECSLRRIVLTEMEKKQLTNNPYNIGKSSVKAKFKKVFLYWFHYAKQRSNIIWLLQKNQSHYMGLVFPYKLFQNGLDKNCGRHSKKFEVIFTDHNTSAVYHKLFMVHA